MTVCLSGNMRRSELVIYIVTYLLIMGNCYKETWLKLSKISNLKTYNKTATVKLRHKM
jgi:hypothetical protein